MMMANCNDNNKTHRDGDQEAARPGQPILVHYILVYYIYYLLLF